MLLVVDIHIIYVRPDLALMDGLVILTVDLDLYTYMSLMLIMET